MGCPFELHPAESMVLTIARAQAERGDDLTPNIALAVLATLDRLLAEHLEMVGTP